MRKKKCFMLVFCATVFLYMVIFTAYGGTKNEGTALSINFDVTPKAQVTKVSCYIKELNKKPSLHVNLAVKNVSEKAQRFNVKLHLKDSGQNVGGYLPRKGKKGKPPLMEPGKIGNVTFAMFYEKLPKSISIKITSK